MTTDERARRALQGKLEEILGDEHALTLMENLPRSEPATKDDLRGLEERFDLRLEALEHRLTATFRAELHSELGREIGSLRSELRGEIGGLRGELLSQIGGLRSDLAAQTRTYMFATIGAVGTMGALILAAVRLV